MEHLKVSAGIAALVFVVVVVIKYFTFFSILFCMVTFFLACVLVIGAFNYVHSIRAKYMYHYSPALPEYRSMRDGARIELVIEKNKNRVEQAIEWKKPINLDYEKPHDGDISDDGRMIFEDDMWRPYNEESLAECFKNKKNSG